MGKKNLMMIMMVAFVTMLLMVLPVSAVTSGKLIGQGSTVFIGEEGLDITSAMGTSVTLGYWSSGANLDTTAPSFTIPVSSRLTTFSVSPVDFVGRTGNWYRINDANHQDGLAFRVEDPSVSLSIMKISDDTNVGGKTVTDGTDLTFDIQTNVILDNKRGDSIVTTSAPIADFATSINPVNGIVTFTATPSGGSAPYYYAWDYNNDGSIDATTSIYTHVYASSHNVNLSVWNNVNNVTGDKHSVIIKMVSTIAPTSYNATLVQKSIVSPVPSTAPISNFIVGGVTDDGTVMFTDTSSPTPTSWAWDFTGDGSVDSILQSPNYKYSLVTGTYNVTLTTSNADNADTGTKSIAMKNITIASSFYTMGTITPTLASSPDPSSASITVLNKIGYMNIVVKSYGGATYNSLVGDSGAVTLLNQFIDKNPFTWNGTWDTGATSGGQRIYQTGVYTVYAECNLNKMKDNYKSGSADYTGKTVSPVNTVTIGTSSVKMTVSKDTIVRGNPFSVTIIGESSAYYTLTIKGVSSLTTEQIPQVTLFQSGVELTSTSNVFNVSLDTSGTRTVGFTTSGATKDQKYTFRVQSTLNAQKYDEVTVSVVKGGMTLVASGDQSYFLGEEIKLSGTNTESDMTYFFIVGPNLNSNGASLDGSGDSIINDVDSTFVSADVDSSDVFTYDWSTSMADLDSGTYTIYGVSKPKDKSHISDAAYATVSVIIKKPYVSATSRGTVAKGDKILITGVAEGQPSNGVAVWILGKNYATIHTQSIDIDGTYEYEIPGADTSSMSSGQYFVVVQHPMQNDKFDIVPTNYNLRTSGDVFIENLQLSGSGMTIFKIGGSGSLQGSDAAEALIQAISDPNIDDTYTKLTIFVEEPLISINTIGDRHIGDKFNITGRTNLAVDDEILMEIYSSSFKPTQKTQSGEFSGATGTIKVVKGESGFNAFSFDIDASTFKIDEYIVIAQSVIQGTTGTTLFNVVEGASTTKTPVVTPVVTAPVIITVPPTPPPQTVPPTVPPTTVVPTTTKEAPGFGAVYALAGLGAVAFVIVRRK